MSGRKRALLIAVEEYDDPGFTRLRSPVHDIEALAEVLSDPEIGAFEVELRQNEPAHQLAEAIEGFFADAHRDDLLLLHLSCHGIKDPLGALFFVATNTKLTRLGSTGLSAQDVNKFMGHSSSRRCVMLLDCCYSGAFEPGMRPRAASHVDIFGQAKPHLHGRGKAVLTASSATEYAFEGGSQLESESETLSSVFTSAVVQGLRSGDADVDQDGHVSVDDLYEYVREKVRETSGGQTPQLSKYSFDGKLVLARTFVSQATSGVVPTEPEPCVQVSIPLARQFAELALLRGSRRLRQADVARLMNTTQSAVSRLERGLYLPTPGQAVAYLQAVTGLEDAGDQQHRLLDLLNDEQPRQKFWGDMPELTEPVAGQRLNQRQLAYKSRASALRQAEKWQKVLRDHPSFDPQVSHCRVAAGDARDERGRWPLVWTAELPR